MIPFNKPYLSGKELEYIGQAVASGKISGNGDFTKKCHHYFQQRYGFGKCLLTSSCTDALEMAAILANIQPGDEVIMPSYTFVSTANAFALRGAKVVFTDSEPERPHMDATLIERAITPRTRAIVPVHYAGMACDMDKIMDLAGKYNLLVIEDAAQSIDGYYKGRPLGSIGHLAALSFHETKNIIAGEGGMLVINDKRFEHRAEIIWEKGTNRAAFWRGEVDKYGWVDIGSSFLPSEVTAAFLWAQLENLDAIQTKRKDIWSCYMQGLANWATQNEVQLPVVPEYTQQNGHIFYMECTSLEIRTQLIAHLKKHGISAVFHYLSLSKSPYYTSKYEGEPTPRSDRYTDCLVRLPLFFELTTDDHRHVVSTITSFNYH